MKIIGSIFLLTISLFCFSQNLQITGSGFAALVETTQGENWLISKEASQYKIYTEDFSLVATFSLSAYPSTNLWIYGAARDFDDDENIEVLFQVQNSSYHSSVYLLDIETNTVQVEYTGNSSYNYYCWTTGYLGGERVFSIQRMNMGNSQYDANYVYRSGVQSAASDYTVTKPAFQLHQNAPNPFFIGNSARNNTAFSFEIKENKPVSLILYNIKGQKVATLLNQEKIGKGNHTVHWSGMSDFGFFVPSGNYLYELQVGNESQFKKTIVIK
jgi:hypothetical protein